MLPRLVNCAIFFVSFVALACAQQDAEKSVTNEPKFEQTLKKEDVATYGNPARGALIFSSPTQACLSCHQVGKAGGQVGPNLSQIATQRKFSEIVDSLWNPQNQVEESYRSVAVLLIDGKLVRGYKVIENEKELVLKDQGTGTKHTLSKDDIEAVKEVGSLMPNGLMEALTNQQRYDLLAFLDELGNYQRIDAGAIDALFSHAHAHHPESFDMPRAPLEIDRWLSWEEEVNRDRVYDFYRKQARHFRDIDPRPNLLSEFPGLDGGKYGHWGNQSEPVWADSRWSMSDLGSLQSGVFHGDGISIARGICVNLTAENESISVCFDPDQLSYPRVWSDGFVTFTSVRHGFMQGVRQVGKTLQVSEKISGIDEQIIREAKQKKFLGYYRDGDRVLFCYEIDGEQYLDEPTFRNGVFERFIQKVQQHPARDVINGGAPRYEKEIITKGALGQGIPYAVDTITLPFENPWGSLIYSGGHDFMEDGSVMLCTMQGDIWHGRGIDHDLTEIRWRKFASGLHQPLGLYIEQDQVYVQCRDQITRLHDLNDDGEADYYEPYSRALSTSKSGHDFTCGLQRDAAGRFYTASGLQGVMRVSSDGESAEVLATGLRNSDGIGLTPDGLVTVPSSEGDWMPASMIAAIRPDGDVLNRFARADEAGSGSPKPFFGRPGVNLTHPPEIPMLYLPRGLDNSSGGQVYISSQRWGPVHGNLVHLSFGAGRAFLLLRDEFDGWIQGAVVPIAGEMLSGVHRARFNPVDGQLYVSGMAGWGTYTTQDGCLQRIRYTGGEETQLPIDFHIHENGIRVSFSQPVDHSVVVQTANHFAQAWNYRYSGAYGSPEYSHRQLGLRGHDVISIQSVTVLEGSREIFLEMRNLQLVNQLHLLIRTSEDEDHDLFLTVNRMDVPFQQIDGYQAVEKVRLPHPMLSDLERPMATKRNPHGKPIPNAREITIAASKNLMFDRDHFTAQPGEVIRLTFKNPDAVPHNWALIEQDSLEEIGLLCNRLISDPDAVANQYIPDTKKVIAYTNIVEPFSEHTIYFRAPNEPGKYPFLCTFPGHWMVMNGWIEVQSP